MIKNGEVVFIISKSRISPINQKLTLPRLQLSGELTAAKLAKYLKELFSISEKNIYLWTDKIIVIHWIKSVPERWKPFIKNRAIEIQSLANPNNWKHYSDKSNPADMLSRGCSAENLLSSKLRRLGPD